MEKYKYIFVVLVYKNTDVLKGFLDSLHLVDNYKVVLVNSFYDESSEKLCKDYADLYGADYISVPNKGYGAGNNEGIKHSKEKYDYEYLIISNSDIILKTLNDNNLGDSVAIYAPQTIMLNGKRQNPNIVYHSSVYDYFSDLSYIKNISWLLVIPHAISRFSREITQFYVKVFKREKIKIFSAHGSFLIITRNAVDKLIPLFNERMFLYNEELYLAFRAKKQGVPIFFCPSIEVFHLEGASTDKGSGNSFSYEVNRSSYLIMKEYRECL